MVRRFAPHINPRGTDARLYRIVVYGGVWHDGIPVPRKMCGRKHRKNAKNTIFDQFYTKLSWSESLVIGSNIIVLQWMFEILGKFLRLKYIVVRENSENMRNFPYSLVNFSTDDLTKMLCSKSHGNKSMTWFHRGGVRYTSNFSLLWALLPEET